MYIPKFNLVTDHKEILEFITHYNFVAVVSARDNLPTATHLPVVVTEEEGKVIIYGHYAKANPQWKEIDKQTVMLIFAEPHAYISPKYYTHLQNVPTWNYSAVHLYGKAEIIESRQGTIDVLERSMDVFEPAYKEQWKKLDEKYVSAMLNEIVAFKIVATDIQAKKKLSQNRSEEERQRIVDAFSKSTNPNEQEIAEQMRHLKK